MLLAIAARRVADRCSVCLYMYVCVYACMHAWMDGWTDGWMYTHIYIYINYINICIYIYQPLNIRNLRPENLAYYRKLLVLVYERTESQKPCPQREVGRCRPSVEALLSGLSQSRADDMLSHRHGKSVPRALQAESVETAPMSHGLANLLSGWAAQ